jgi:Skp family chaperone for outer membrane proteins
LAVALAAVCLGAVPPASAQGTGTNVAVANIRRIFNDMQETKDVTQRMDNEQKALRAEGDQRQAKLKQLQDARDVLKVGSPQYEDQNRQLITASAETKAWMEGAQAQFQHTQKVQTKLLFEKIQNAVVELATERNIDLVLTQTQLDIPDNLDRINVEQLQGLINTRNVLFASPKVDISNEVIARLDAKYKAGKK